MPCYEGPSRNEILAAKMPAVLCAVVRILGPQELIEKLDWKEIGVLPGEFEEWWREHDERDMRRRAESPTPPSTSR